MSSTLQLSTRATNLRDCLKSVVPLPAIALVLTTIQCALDEWKAESISRPSLLCLVGAERFFRCRMTFRMRGWFHYCFVSYQTNVYSRSYAGVNPIFQTSLVRHSISDDDFAADEAQTVTALPPPLD
ncbi:hypothetical protein C8J56DRAFT_1029863 [Mycena floridula]|nr:hypothetical protein C8J56DRAFT_1029863 [Mycena floridula]